MKDDLKFSQRIGITPATKKLQVDSMDDDLRNGLWNIYRIMLIDISKKSVSEQNSFSNILWDLFFKKTLDEIPMYANGSVVFDDIIICLKEFFYECKWFEVYELIEFTLKIPQMDKASMNIFNMVFKRENSAYRFVNKKLAPITNSNEIEEIQKAIDISGSCTALEGCNIHLTEALNKLSDKQNPDYRNSIKESISAVESIAKVVSGKKNDTLKPALDKIKNKIKLHQALVEGFKKIYDYTSDEGGVRHATMDKPNCDIEDARFMLVSCSAFVNYLIAKAEKADIEFN